MSSGDQTYLARNEDRTLAAMGAGARPVPCRFDNLRWGSRMVELAGDNRIL